MYNSLAHISYSTKLVTDRYLGQFGLFRAWAYGHAADNGDGWIERNKLETLWRHVGIAHSPRHARRLIKNGVNEGYWTQDKTNKRIYLAGQVKVAAQLVRKAMESSEDIIGTNLPGRRRVDVSLAGSLQEASARLYAAWFVSKDTRCNGTIISRETLCNLWGVSVPTLLAWERIAGIDGQANYAQQKDTAIDHVPEYAYLTLNRDGGLAFTKHLHRWRSDNPEAFSHRQSETSKARSS